LESTWLSTRYGTYEKAFAIFSLFTAKASAHSLGKTPRLHTKSTRKPCSWRDQQSFGLHGIAQVRLYDPYGPGDVTRYISKGRFSSAADCESANTYELRKFDRADWLYISPGAWAEMREARTVAMRMSPLLS
jgi:hypothetical protein